MDREEITETKSRWSKPLAVGAIVGTILVCIVGVAYSKTDIGEAAKDAQKNKAEAEAQSLLFTSDQVAKLYSVPDAENGASLVKEVLNVVKENAWDSQRVTEQMVAQKQAVFDSAFAKLEEASKRKYLIFKRPLSSPNAIMYPEYSNIKSWVKFLCLLAHLASERGDAAKAQRYLGVAAHLSTVTDSEGILISVLVRVATAIIVETELKEIFAAHGKEPAWQQAIEKTLQRLDKPYDAKKILMLEHWFAVSAVDEVMKDPSAFYSSFGGSSGTPMSLRAGKYIPRFKEANLSRINKAYAVAAALVPSDPYDFVKTKTAYRSLEESSMKQGMSYTLLSIVAPVFSQSIIAMSREVSYRNALLQAVTLVKQGQDPRRGLPLKDRHRFDLDDKDLRIKQVNGRWVIYSVGYNLSDEGGVELNNLKGDWVIKLPK